MALTNLTADQIDGHEPQRANNALLVFNLAGITGYGTFSGGSGASQAPSSSTVQLSIEDFPLPQPSMTGFQLGYLNEMRNFVGRPQYPGMSIRFKDFVDVDTAGQLYLWYTASHNPATGQTFYKSNYVVQGLAIMYPPDGSASHTPRQWTLWNCICDSFSSPNFSMSGDGPAMVEITIKIDKFYPTVYAGGSNY